MSEALARRPHRLRVEHPREPLGIGTRVPRLSWWLPSGGGRQGAYRVRADNGWDTGRVDSGESVLVNYSGPTLSTGERVGWQVKVWMEGGRATGHSAAASRSACSIPTTGRPHGSPPWSASDRPPGRVRPCSCAVSSTSAMVPRAGGPPARPDSPYGTIGTTWRLRAERFELELTVPPGTSADVVLPDGTRRDAGPGRHTWS